jgi:hypothetical protein
MEHLKTPIFKFVVYGFFYEHVSCIYPRLYSLNVMINQLQIDIDLHASCREIRDALALQLRGGTVRSLFSITPCNLMCRF